MTPSQPTWVLSPRKAVTVHVGHRHLLLFTFVGAEKFLGDRRLSYNSLLTFTLYLDDDHDDVLASTGDLVLEGDGRSVSAPVYAQGNPSPGRTSHRYRYRLSEHRSHQWTPRLSTADFVRLLANLTAITIRADFSAQGTRPQMTNGFVVESSCEVVCST